VTSLANTLYYVDKKATRNHENAKFNKTGNCMGNPNFKLFIKFSIYTLSFYMSLLTLYIKRNPFTAENQTLKP